MVSRRIGYWADGDDVTGGEFWLARNRGLRPLDETAALACAAYLDLNPIWAATAEATTASTRRLR